MTTKQVPSEAMRCAAGELSFAFADSNQSKYPFKMVARTGQPIEHWYWGRIIHDLSGMMLSRPSVPIDWCHDDDEVIGFGNKFDVSSGDLVVEGELVPFQEDDRASEVIHKGRAGIPYESSIDFSGNGIVIEEVGIGASVEVNGYTFEGPGVVVRKWPLRGVAICPHGADQNTSTSFATGADDAPITVTLFSRNGDMKKDKTELAADAEKLTATENPTPTETKPISPDGVRAELARFVAKFGAEHGAKWFTEGKSYDEALELHVQQLTSQITERDQQVAKLREQIASLELGESKPVDSRPAEKLAKGRGLAALVRVPGSAK